MDHVLYLVACLFAKGFDHCYVARLTVFSGLSAHAQIPNPIQTGDLQYVRVPEVKIDLLVSAGLKCLGCWLIASLFLGGQSRQGWRAYKGLTYSFLKAPCVFQDDQVTSILIS